MNSKEKSKGVAFVAVGFELVGLMLGSLFIGQKIDKYYGWPGWALTGLSMLALAGWLTRVVYMAQKMTENGDDIE
jgi:hypothetical protein